MWRTLPINLGNSASSLQPGLWKGKKCLQLRCETETNPSSGLYLQGEEFYTTLPQREKKNPVMQKFAPCHREGDEVRSQRWSKRSSLLWQDTFPWRNPAHQSCAIGLSTGSIHPSCCTSFTYQFPKLWFLEFLF